MNESYSCSPIRNTDDNRTNNSVERQKRFLKMTFWKLKASYHIIDENYLRSKKCIFEKCWMNFVQSYSNICFQEITILRQKWILKYFPLLSFSNRNNFWLRLILYLYSVFQNSIIQGEIYSVIGSFMLPGRLRGSGD